MMMMKRLSLTAGESEGSNVSLSEYRKDHFCGTHKTRFSQAEPSRGAATVAAARDRGGGCGRGVSDHPGIQDVPAGAGHAPRQTRATRQVQQGCHHREQTHHLSSAPSWVREIVPKYNLSIFHCVQNIQCDHDCSNRAHETVTKGMNSICTKGQSF